MKVIDCFIYFDEDLLLDLRLNLLNSIVDKFVIVESKITHSGKNKDLTELTDILKLKKIKNVKLPVSAPFHCNLMSKATKIMEEQIEKEAMEKYGSKDSGASLGAILGKALGRDKKEE